MEAADEELRWLTVVYVAVEDGRQTSGSIAEIQIS